MELLGDSQGEGRDQEQNLLLTPFFVSGGGKILGPGCCCFRQPIYTAFNIVYIILKTFFIVIYKKNVNRAVNFMLSIYFLDIFNAINVSLPFTKI